MTKRKHFNRKLKLGFLGMAAILLAIGLSIAACDYPNNEVVAANTASDIATAAASTASTASDIDKAATPTASYASGTYSCDIRVALSCATQGAKIYYTRDGSTPTRESIPYEDAIFGAQPFLIYSTTTIKAIAVKDGMEDSDVSTYTYTIQKIDLTKPYDSLSGAGWSKSGNVFTISGAGRTYSVEYSTGEGASSNCNRVVVDCSATIILQDVTIDLTSLGWNAVDAYPAIEIKPGAVVTLLLQGNNVLKAAGFGAGLCVPQDATVRIDSVDSTNPGTDRSSHSTWDSLSASAYDIANITGAGIGSNCNPVGPSIAGTIIIDGGSITASGWGGGTKTGSGAGIGSGAGEGGNGGTITINGGIVTATGGYWKNRGGAGIGGGWYGNSGIITINGGDVTANGGSNGAGIGGGCSGSGQQIRINGGTVRAAGGNWAAGIGGGHNGNAGTIVIDTTHSSGRASFSLSAPPVGNGYHGSSGTYNGGSTFPAANDGNSFVWGSLAQ